MAKPEPQKQSSWTNTQVYTAIIVVLIVGGLGGYLLHNSSSSPAPAAESPALGQPVMQQAINPAQAMDAEEPVRCSPAWKATPRTSRPSSSSAISTSTPAVRPGHPVLHPGAE